MEDLLVSWHEETCEVNLLEAVKYRNSCQDLWDLSSCVNRTPIGLLHPNPQQSTLVNSWVVRLFVSIQVSSVLIPQTTIFQFLLSTKLLRIDSQFFSIPEKSVEVTEKPECPEPETEPENESPVKKKSGKKSKGEKKLFSVDILDHFLAEKMPVAVVTFDCNFSIEATGSSLSIALYH